MLDLRITSRFKKELKKAERQQKAMIKLSAGIDTLQAEKTLPESNHDHALTGDYIGHRECHLEPDWLLIYKVENGQLILVRTGSHSELFS